MTLEAILAVLEKYGKPILGRLSTGWYCQVEIHSPAVGVCGTIRSEFGHGSPFVAAKQCQERLFPFLPQPDAERPRLGMAP